VKAPARERIERGSQALRNVPAAPEAAERLALRGIDVPPSTPRQIDVQPARWDAVTRAADIQAE
jgi:hypothetical protein